jgi:hypothetical protein
MIIPAFYERMIHGSKIEEDACPFTHESRL